MKRPPLSGAVLQQSVLDEARARGWRSAHFRPALSAKGWRTPVAGDGKGYPDLHLIRERSVFVEIKGDGDTLSPEQEQWLAWLKAAGHEVYVWTPDDWFSDRVRGVLTTRRPASTTTSAAAPSAERVLRVLHELAERGEALERAASALADVPLTYASQVYQPLEQLVRQLCELERDVWSDSVASSAAETKNGVKPPKLAPETVGVFEYRVFLPPDGIRWEVVRADSLAEAVAKRPDAQSVRRIFKASELEKARA